MTYQPNNQRSRRDRSSRPNSKKRKHNNSNSNNHTNNSNNSKITKRNKKTTYSSRDNNRYNSRYNNNNSSHPTQPHYTPPPRHRKEHKHNKHRGGHYINNVKCEDIPVPEPINNKRRPSYSDTINEEEQEQHHKEEEEEEDEEDEEREEHDLICEESPISDIITNEHIHSDSNPSENEKNVYLHNNRKHNYYYQRKPMSNTSNKPIIPSPNNENQLIIHNGDDVHIKMNGNINPNSIESTQFELDLRKNNINHNNMNMNMNNNNNMNNNSNITPNYAASASSCSRSPAYSAPNQNDYPPINNMNLNTINNPYQQQQQQQYVTNTNNIGCYNNNMYNNNGYDMAYNHYHTHYNNHNHHHHHHSHHAHQYPLYPPYINGYNITGTNINNITPPSIAPSIPTSSTSTSGSRAATPSLQSSSYNIMYDQSVQPPFYQTDGEFFVSIDVECAATGYGHFDSAPCRIAMVDFFGNILFDEIATVPNIVDPLLEFTGLTKHDIATKGDSLDHVLSRFHAELFQLNKTYKYGVTIVGQSVIMDIIWTKLRKNVHYNRTIDIAHQFRTKNEKWSSKYTYYSLRQVAWALLKRGMNDKYHDPTEDARVTIQLYRDFCLDADDIETAKRILKEYKYKNAFPDFRVHTKFTQCSGMYSPNKCICGQKTAQGINGINQIEKLRKLYQEHANKPVLYRKYNHY